MGRLTEHLKLLVILFLLGGFGSASLMIVLDFQALGIILSQLTLALIIGLVGLRGVSDRRRLRNDLQKLRHEASRPEAVVPQSPEQRDNRTLHSVSDPMANVQALLERLERAAVVHNVELEHLSSQVARTSATLEANNQNQLPTDAHDSGLSDRLDAVEQKINLVHSLVEGSNGYRGNDVVSRVVQQLESTIGLYALVGPRLILPPSRGWAASPDFLAVIFNEVLSRLAPPTVFECGTGLSTLVTAYALERRQDNGSLLSLEHDPKHAERVSHDLYLHALPGVELVTAPLVWMELHSKEQQNEGGNDSLWYDTSLFDPPSNIDLLIVDGPPGRSSLDARYPALPILSQNLAPDAVILLDDAQRGDESRIAQRWAEELGPCTLDWLKTEKGTAVLRRIHDG